MCVCVYVCVCVCLCVCECVCVCVCVGVCVGVLKRQAYIGILSLWSCVISTFLFANIKQIILWFNRVRLIQLFVLQIHV